MLMCLYFYYVSYFYSLNTFMSLFLPFRNLFQKSLLRKLSKIIGKIYYIIMFIKKILRENL